MGIFFTEHGIQYKTVSLIHGCKVGVYVDGRDTRAEGMTEGEGYGVFGDTETEGERRPCMARVIGREAGMKLTEAAVHARHEVTIVLHTLAPREQEAGATVAVYDFPCFRRYKNGVETVRLAAVELYPAIMNAVGWEGKQVADINAEQAEGETEAVEIALLPRLHIEGKERTQLIE